MSQKSGGFFESKGFKNFMKYTYGIGAGVVILGALFKILHWPGANEMLIAGMGTETFIFIISAFEPLHEDLDWGRVYPQLRDGGEFDGEDEVYDEMEGISYAEGVAKTSDMLKNGLNPEMFETISSTLTTLSNNVNQLAAIETSTVASEDYNKQLKEAAKKMGETNRAYTATLDSLTDLSGSVSTTQSDLAKSLETIKTSMESSAEYSTAYNTEISAVTKNLNSLNGIYEQELKDSQAHIKSVNKFYEGLSSVMSNMMEASKDAEAYQQEVSSLTSNLHVLNTIYGNMISAMSKGANA